MSNYELKSQIRTITGRKVKALRKQGIVPANVFGKNKPSTSIQAELKPLLAVLKAAGETGLINLAIEGEKKVRPVLVAAYAQNPITGDLLHVDFHEVDLTQKTTAMVQIKVVGESEAVKAGNVLVLQKNEIEVEALPADLPEHLEVDISTLTEVGSTIHAKDIKVDHTKITLMVDLEEVVATVQEPAKEEVVAAPAESSEAPAPAEGESKPAEPEAKKSE